MTPVLRPETIDLLQNAWSVPKPRRRGAGLGFKPGGAVTELLSGAGASSHGARSAAAVAKLSSLTRRAPEVLVKVSGRQNGAGHVASNFTYIAGREGREGRDSGIETSEERTLFKAEEFARLAKEWDAWERADGRRRQGATSISMVFSMPEGTNPDKLKDAVRSVAHKEFGDFRWVLGIHTDTPRPHAHLTVARRGLEGPRLHPGREDLFRYRELFADELRTRGIEAEATPRKARGVVKKADRTPIHKMKAKARAADKLTMLPRVTQEQMKAAADRVKRIEAGEPAGLRDVDKKALNRQEQSRHALAMAAQDLAKSSDPDHQTLAATVRKFIRDMPAPETRDMAMMRNVAQSRRDNQERSRQEQARTASTSERTKEQQPDRARGRDRDRDVSH